MKVKDLPPDKEAAPLTVSAIIALRF